MKFTIKLLPLFITALALCPPANGQGPVMETPIPPDDAIVTPAEADEAAANTESAKPKAPAQPALKGVTSSNPGAEKVRLFILSGQSNMVLMDESKSFTPAVEAAFPGEDVVVVKDAQSGESIRRWLKKWKPAEGVVLEKPYKARGYLYDRLKTKVTAAMKNKPDPISVAFIWMQGETDASEKAVAGNYDDSLRELISSVRFDMKSPKMPVVIGQLNDSTDPVKRPEWDTIKAKQEAFVKADVNAALVKTDDLNGDQNKVHFNAAGYQELGQRFADAAIKLLKEAK